MADYKVTDTELTSIANAIRTKGGTQSQLVFPAGFVSAINAIPSGGGGSIVFKDYALFDGSKNLLLNGLTINEDYKITVDFDALTFFSNQAVIGNNSYSAASFVHLTQYGDRWYTSAGSTETNFVAQTTGRHTFICNINGKNVFDGVEVTNYTPTNYDGANLVVAGRPGGGGRNFTGKIYSYKIESISTGNILAYLLPAEIIIDNKKMFSGLLDMSGNGHFFAEDGFTIGNDE